ncbi:Type 1 glutamine amidotransferase-like domain-containing protein [Ornithinibacillus halophilus]|uniref:Cyanophycinase n=1 Tax=Ornithinibacillus halophilus TaxID=930117 RepID=A0A1M5LJV7_9BACI|nr:Type 1 glutamine amidotransferase-like domain-containing protein [Ornithinibacillus halophilus]SHG65402.1 cyanophycinase [Ornithinibacillus halophilus]
MKHLFLYGGSPPFTNRLGETYANLVKRKGKVSILFIERPGWEQYMEKYTSVLKLNGIDQFSYMPINTNNTSVEEISESAGIIICGGNTVEYHKYIVGTEIGNGIQQLYNKGIPVAGFSAGALISPTKCVISPIDNSENEQLFYNGLGLVNGCVICVHFSKWKEKNNLKIAVEKTGVSTGYGIDDSVGIYFKNEVLADVEGGELYTYEQLNMGSG